MRILSRVLLVFAAVVAFAAPALSHAHLHASTPRPGAVLKAMPATIRLSFTEAVELKYCRFVLVPLSIAPSASATSQQAAALAVLPSAVAPKSTLPNRVQRVSPSTGSSTDVVLNVHPSARPGVYAVLFQLLSVDGHVTKDAFVFTVRP